MDRGQSLRLWFDDEAERSGKGLLMVRHRAGLESVKSGERDVPDYLEVDHKKMTGKMVRVPTLAEVPYPVQMEPHLVIEFYSR